jgi:hypothetical protein
VQLHSCVTVSGRSGDDGSNMTRTVADWFTHKSVPVIFEPPCNCNSDLFVDRDGWDLGFCFLLGFPPNHLSLTHNCESER